LEQPALAAAIRKIPHSVRAVCAELSMAMRVMEAPDLPEIRPADLLVPPKCTVDLQCAAALARNALQFNHSMV
jgi:hypothetical protein